MSHLEAGVSPFYLPEFVSREEAFQYRSGELGN